VAKTEGKPEAKKDSEKEASSPESRFLVDFVDE
jgi:hypothetical protein